MALNISGRRIRLARQQKGIAQVDLAAALSVEFGIDITQSDISEIERGIRAVRDYELDAIAKALEINPLWLLRGEDIINDKKPIRRRRTANETKQKESR